MEQVSEYPTIFDCYLRGERRLNLGCGARKMTGFVNADLHGKPDVRFDARRPWPIRPGSLDSIFAHHMLEHFTGEELIVIFWEAGRALREGGHLVAATPYGPSALQYSAPLHKQWFTEDSFWHYSSRTFEDDGPSPGMAQGTKLHNWRPVAAYFVPTEDFAHLDPESKEFRFALRHYLNVVREMYFVLRRDA